MVRGLVAGHCDELGRFRGPTLGNQREPAPVIHGGEQAGPIGRQAAHHGEEALVGGVGAQPLVQCDEPQGIVLSDGADAEARAILEHHLALELAGIGRGRPHAGAYGSGGCPREEYR